LKEEIPELYIAIRNFAKNCGVDCKNPRGLIEEETCKMSSPNGDVIQRFFKKEDIEKWERILSNE